MVPQIEMQRADVAERHGVRVAYEGADMSVPEEIAAMIDAARRAFGSVDILVSNAGIQHVEPTETFPAEKSNAIIATTSPRPSTPSTPALAR